MSPDEPGCQGCDFYNDRRCKKPYFSSCIKYSRNDEQDVVFKRKPDQPDLTTTDHVTYPINDRLMRQAILLFGEDCQINMLVGEIGELLTLVGRRAQERDSQDEWVSEIADSLIMIRQLMLILNVQDDVISMIERKQHRLRNRIASMVTGESTE